MNTWRQITQDIADRQREREGEWERDRGMDSKRQTEREREREREGGRQRAETVNLSINIKKINPSMSSPPQTNPINIYCSYRAQTDWLAPNLVSFYINRAWKCIKVHHRIRNGHTATVWQSQGGMKRSRGQKSERLLFYQTTEYHFMHNMTYCRI